MGTVMAAGTFDILHAGHVNYLKQARKLGERLVVIVATDSNVQKTKGEKPLNGQEHRRDLIASLGFVDETMIGSDKDILDSVEKIRPDVIAMGYDQRPGNEELAKRLAKRGIKAKIVRLEPYKENLYKSSKIKRSLREFRA